MKTLTLILSLLAAGAGTLTASQTTTPAKPVPPAQVPAPTAYHVVNRGANSRVWQRETYEHSPTGQVISHVHKYTELATGMHYRDAQGNWVESKELIESFPQGAIARQGPYQVIFANNLNSEGAIDLQTPDQKRLRSNILGLRYYDTASGQAVLIAQIQDSQGELISSKQVLYPNAFSGVKADVRYTYRKGRFEQDVILREQLLDPAAYGLNPATTEVEVMTEFLNPPAETITAGKAASNGETDENVSWGAMSLGHGKAFDLNDANDVRSYLTVSRQYVTVQGRKVLLEKVPLPKVRPGLQHLPLHAGIRLPSSKTTMLAAVLPPAPAAQTSPAPIKLATRPAGKEGYVLDYVELYTDQSDFTFLGDMTYYINGDVGLSGVTTIQGGAVLKYSTAGELDVDSVVCQTSAYHPAVFTSYSDDTVGETVPGADACDSTLYCNIQNDTGADIYYWAVGDVSGSYLAAGDSVDFSFTAGLGASYSVWGENDDLDGFYGNIYTTLDSGSVDIGSDGSVNYFEIGSELCSLFVPSSALSLANGGNLHDLRFCNLAGVVMDAAADCCLTNVQFVNCGTAVQTMSAHLHAGNILMSQVGTGFYGQHFHGDVEQLTLDQATLLTGDPDGGGTTSTLALTNCLLTAVGGLGVVPLATNAVVELSSGLGVYQKAGGGGYYLTNSTPSYRGAGTTNINPALLAELQTKTTWPPNVYSNVTIATNTLSPQVPRDTNAAPDIGYHYDSLDYEMTGVTATNSTFTVMPGTVVGLAFDSHAAAGLHVNGPLTCQGTVAQPIYFVSATMVQEQAHVAVGSCPPLLNVSNATVQFTKFIAGQWMSPWDQWPLGGTTAVQNCEFYACDVNLLMHSCASDVNCLFVGVKLFDWCATAAGSILRNNTFVRCDAVYVEPTGTSPVVADNLFDSCYLDNWATYTVGGGYNYYINCGDHLSLPVDRVTSGSVGYLNGPLGDYYVPAVDFSNIGSTNANLLGLYHFTTQTSQLQETNSIVDIGYHYVAVNANGIPFDVNGDGIPDYLEDANGNGLADNGETNWGITILIQPQSQTIVWGSNVTFTVTAAGVAPLHYQWYFNGSTNLSVTTSASLSLTNVQFSQAGSYSVVVTNQFGAITSSFAVLSVPSVSIVYTNFCDVSAIQINVTAVATNTSDGCVLELTEPLGGQAGSAFLKAPIPLASHASFSTAFSFRLSKGGGGADVDGIVGGNGFVFVAQTRANNLVGLGGGYLGYGQIPANQIFTNCSVGVEFDTHFNNGENGDGIYDPTDAPGQDGNHIGIDTNGCLNSLAWKHIAQPLNNSNIWYAWIDYNGTTSNLQMSVSMTNSRPYPAILATNFNLADYLGGTNVYFGFTAGTGGSINQQDILSWQLNFPASITPTNLSVVILSPTNQTFLDRSNVTVTAFATNSSPGFPVDWVQLFDGTNSVAYGVSTNGFYVMNWVPDTAGTHVLTALAVNTNGPSAWSSPVTNYVVSLPTVQISSPTNGQIFSYSPTNIVLTATAAAYGGATVAKVLYYAGTTILGTNNAGPSYAFIWSNVVAGTYALHAKVFDSTGVSGISSNIFITVEPTNRPPFVFAGSNQTNYLFTNWVSLNGFASDDGLPIGSTLSVNWTNLSGGTNVTFLNSNAPTASAFYWATGSYILRLSANDGQFTNSSYITNTVCLSNQPPWVFAGISQTNILPWVDTNPVATVSDVLIAHFTNPNGVDYYPKSNCIVTTAYTTTGNPFNFMLVSTNGMTNQFSSLSNLTGELYISTVRNTLGGFKPGEMFCGNGVNGQIMRIEPDGTTVGTNSWANGLVVYSNAWLVLPTLIFSNGTVVTPGSVRGLWVDRTGAWGGDLIVATVVDNGDPGDIWRVNSAGQATLLAHIKATGDNYSFEGMTTIPDDVARYGPWAGRILVGGDAPGAFFAIDTNGFVARYNFPFGAEAIRVIPPNENLFGCDQSAGVWGIPANQFLSMVGDVLVADENENSPYLYRIHWNGATFDTYPLFKALHIWEGVNFAPAGSMTLPSAGMQLQGVVTDDGEIFSPTINHWSVVSGPGPVTFNDPSQTNTLAEFSVPGVYVFQLSAYDGQYTSVSNVTMYVLQNHPPSVYAGTNQFLAGVTNTTLQGTVGDDGLPEVPAVTNIAWSLSSFSGLYNGFRGFSNSNALNPTISFNANDNGYAGTYTFLLTADDGQATNTSQVLVNFEAPTLTLTPAYGPATRTNTPYMVTARLLDINGLPITNTTVTFEVDVPTYGSQLTVPATTDINGYASFTYSNIVIFARETITAEATVLPYDVHSQPVIKDRGFVLNCGDSYISKYVGQDLELFPYWDGVTSVEFPKCPADYYVFNGTSNDTIHLTLKQYDDPLMIYMKDPGGRLVAWTEVNYSTPGNVNFVNYTLTTNGDYLIEVFGQNHSKYDLYLDCDSETNGPAPNMDVLYQGTNVPNGGTVIFPSTTLNAHTNITLVITNAGNLGFNILGLGTNGDFILTNNVFGHLIPVPTNSSTNFGIQFNASSIGVSLGILVLSNSTYGSNYNVYFQAFTAPTDAIPVVQLIQPAYGSTVFDNQPVDFTASVMLYGEPISHVINAASGVTVNTLNPSSFGGTSLLFDSGNDYTGSYQLGSVNDGDLVMTVTAVDIIGQTGHSPPVLIHVLPYHPVLPTEAPGIAVFLNGTNIPSGGTIVFPPTRPGVTTSLSLLITNTGTYPLGIMETPVNGDFDLTNNVTGVIMPGGTTNLGLVFYADGSGQAVGQLAISNNASIGEEYVVSLVGNANTVDYVPPSTNAPQPPVAWPDGFHVQANSVNNLLLPLTNDIDPNGYPLKIVAVTAPGNGGSATIVNFGTAVNYTPPKNVRGNPDQAADGFYYTITNGYGGGDQGVVSVFIDASDLPYVVFTNTPTSASAGTMVPIVASVTPSENIVKVDFFMGQNLIGTTNGVTGLYTNFWTAVSDEASGYEFTAQATDKYGQLNTSSPIHINVVTNGLSGYVVASLYSVVDSTSTNVWNPTNLVTIRDGLFKLYGRAYHSLGSNDVVWQLGVYSLDGTLIRDLTPTNTSQAGNAGSASNLLSCDLTTLQNGVYTLKLTVTGGYQMAETNVEFRLESNLKIGQFSFSQQDLIIPVNGIPLTVTRTYNSINPDKGDFGYGWTYALSDMDVSIDETREDVKDLDDDVFSQRSGGSWDVTLTLPTGQRTTFSFYFDPADAYGTFVPRWQAAPGITAKLEAHNSAKFNTLYSSVVNDPDLAFWDGGDPVNVYDIPGFVLTMKDGTKFYIDREDLEIHDIDNGGEGYEVHAYGKPYLSHIVQRTLDTITINQDSVVFQATNGATRKISFQRNDQGLITSVTDPTGLSGGSPPAVKYEYDASDNLINVQNLVDRNAGTYVTNFFTYTNVNFPHYITTIINADGTQVAKNFYDDVSGKLVAVQDADGNVTQFIHNLTNNMDVIIDRRGHTNTYVYDMRGNVISQTNQLGQISTMAYDLNNNKTNETVYFNGQPLTTSYLYDTNNFLLGSTDPLGHTNGFFYDDFGNVKVSSDALGVATTNTYDPVTGQLLSTIDALGHTSSSYYNGGLLMSSVDPLGTTNANFYDPTENLIGTASFDVAGVILSSNTFAYDLDGNRTNSTVWRRVNGVWTGAATAYIYDAMNRVIQTINPDGGYNTVVYDAIGKQQSTIDPLGRTTSYGYDSQGRLIQTTYPDTSVEKSQYDANGNRAFSTDRAGRITTYVYDALNRLTNTIYADGATSVTVYDGVGRVAQTIDARGAVTAFAYDAAGRRLAVTNAFGTTVQTVSSYGYDANGNQITFTDADNHSTTNVFDVLNRQVQVKYPDGTTNSTGYDAAARRVAETNQDGRVTWFGYDGAGRLTTVTNAVNKTEQMVTRYQYDEAGNEIAQMDALNRTNVFIYDLMGRRMAHTRPDAATEGFAYDLAGNLVCHTNFDGVNAVSNSYDVLNRLTQTAYKKADGTDCHYNYTYTSTGQRQSMVDSANGGPVIYTYDNRDRLLQKVVNLGSITMVLNYGYDANGNVTSLRSGYANGVNLAYGYDALNRLTNVLSHGSLAASYGYDAMGNLQGMRYGNGVTNLYQYDGMNRLTNMLWRVNGTNRSFAYQMSAGGTRTNLTEKVDGTPDQSFTWSFDNLYRLTNEVAGSLGSVRYGYDTVGNRTNRVSSGISALATDNFYTYDTNDELMVDASHGSFSSDTNGNVTVETGVASYDYDNLNRLTSSVRSTARTNCFYDGDGNRVKKSGAISTYYLVDDRNPSGYAQVVEEYQEDPSLWQSPAVLTRTYDYGLSLISQQQFDPLTLLPSTVSYYGYDGHGSVRFLMDTNGAITDTYTYDAYGTMIASTYTGTGPTPNNYLYAGQQWDPDLGLYYNRARYLNTDLGRFCSRDSTDGDNEEPLSLHKYLYAQNDPIDGVDPSGMFSDSFGYLVEPAIQDVYEEDHLADEVTYGKWTRLGGLTGNLFRLKPDILNISTKRWAEIKPFTPSGVIKAGLQWTKYQALRTFGYKPDVGWTPKRHYAVVDGTPIIFWNCEGIIFYTDASDQAEDLFALSTYALAKQYMLENGAALTAEEILAPVLVRVSSIIEFSLPAIELDAVPM